MLDIEDRQILLFNFLLQARVVGGRDLHDVLCFLRPRLGVLRKSLLLLMLMRRVIGVAVRGRVPELAF